MTILLLAWLWGCAPADACTLASAAAENAGPGAIDCGSVAAGDDATAALDCAESAFAAGEPFYVLVANQGVDSVLTSATVSDGARTWRFLHDDYNGDVDVDGIDCLEPYVHPDGGIACTATAPEGTHYAVCGDHEGEGPAALPFEP